MIINYLKCPNILDEFAIALYWTSILFRFYFCFRFRFHLFWFYFNSRLRNWDRVSNWESQFFSNLTWKCPFQILLGLGYKSQYQRMQKMLLDSPGHHYRAHRLNLWLAICNLQISDTRPMRMIQLESFKALMTEEPAKRANNLNLIKSA